MAKDFESFEDDQDFDDLVEADPEIEEPEEEEEEAPVKVAPKKIQPVPPIALKKVAKKAPEPIMKELEEQEEDLPAPIVQAQAAKKKEKPVPAARYVAYKTEKRYGLIDNITGQPIAESADAEALTLTILSDILNKLDRIESSL